MIKEKKKKAPMVKSYLHTVRTADGRTKTFKFGRRPAMAMMCTECMGFEGDPKDCSAVLCPLWPWRTRTQISLRGDKKSDDPF